VTSLSSVADRVDAADRSSEAGFTLVELMVVVAIIALLAAVVIPNFVHARAQAAVSQTEANMKQIATALELYYGDNQGYPASGTVNPTLFGGANNPYLTSTPANALTRQPYTYVLTAATAAGVPPTYTLTDPGAYDPTTLQNLPKSKGGTTATLCATACKTINYDPQDGFYGE